jgi:hypothetical protein
MSIKKKFKSSRTLLDSGNEKDAELLANEYLNEK